MSYSQQRNGRRISAWRRNVQQGEHPGQSHQSRQKRYTNGVGSRAQQFFLRDQCHRSAENQPATKTAKMSDDVAGRIEAKQCEQHDSTENAAGDISPGPGVVELERKRLHGQKAESTHDHAGSAKTSTQVRVEKQTRNISSDAGQIGRQQRAGGTVT